MTAYADYVAAPRRLHVKGESWDRLDHGELCERNGAFVFGVTELIRNPHHFGADGLAEYYAWHQHAVLLAARAGRLAKADNSAEAEALLVDALIYEVYSVHFLQDFFAPGHVEAFEKRASLMATLKKHDQGNIREASFRLNTTHLARGSKFPTENVVQCLGLDDAAKEEARKKFEEEVSQGVVKLEGDGRVSNSRAHKVFRLSEATFVTLATALSIQDLVLVYKSPDLSWSDLTFAPNQGPEKSGGYGIACADGRLDAWLPIGHYEDLRPPADCRAMAHASSPEATNRTEGEVEGRKLNSANDPPGSAFLASLPRTALDVSLQRLNEGSRKAISVEAFIEPLTRSPHEHQTVEWSLGYTYLRGNSYSGHGPDASLYYRIKNLYLWGAVGVGWRFLYDAHGSANAPRVSGRIGFGPEIISVFTGVALDSSIEHGRKNVDPLAFEFGVQAVIPWQRAWSLGEELCERAGQRLREVDDSR